MGKQARRSINTYTLCTCLDDPSKSYVGEGGGGVMNFTSSCKIKLSIPLAALLPLQCSKSRQQQQLERRRREELLNDPC